MNVMAQAHKLTKARIAAGTIYTYAELMKRHLIQAHSEYKAMQKEKQDKINDMMFQANTFIGKLEAFLPLAKGYIVTTGELRICVNAEVGTLAYILTTPNYDRIEDANYFAKRVRNGHGEGGQVEVWSDRIRWEIQEQKALIEQLKNI